MEYENVSDNKLFFLSWYNNLTLIWLLYSWRIVNKQILTPYILFMFSCYIFFTGQVLLYSLGLKYEKYDLFTLFNNEELSLAVIFTILSLQCIHLGAILVVEAGKKEEVYKTKLTNISLINSVKFVGLFLVSISFFQYFYYDISLAYKSITSGYGSLYKEDTNAASIFVSLKLFFIPGILLLMTVYKNNHLITKFILSILIFSVLIGYLSGGRGTATALLVVIVWIWHVQISPIRGKTFFSLTFLGLILTSFLSIIGEYRRETEKGLSEFLYFTARSFKEENLLVNIIGELGSSIFPLVKIMELFPTYFQYKFGLTYVYSFLMILPDFVRIDNFEDTSITSPARWLMYTLDMTYGPGFSLIAEAFMNFGWLALLFLILFGSLIGLVFKNFGRNLDERLVYNVFIAVMLYHLIFMVRGTSTLFFRNEVYFVFFPVFLIFLLKNTLYPNYRKKAEGYRRGDQIVK